MLITTRQHERAKKVSLVNSNPKLQAELKDTQKQLNSILNKWKFGDQPLKSATEFLNNFEPWINKKLEQEKELKEFLTKSGVKSLEEIRNINFDNEELEKFLQSHKVNSLTELEEQWKANQGQLPEDYQELITEKDQLAREK